ncbi:hypothetical protein ACJRPK_06920 [Aquimarina sp. 2-A2]|uniref:hypothetical protein n=1 Tax=Aquimarina sp. 2-A2 TaxID=3382644 RepID=UPI00387F2633
MKLSFLIYLNLFLSIFLISCEKENINEEATAANVTELNYTARNSSFCKFNLNGVQANARIGLTCVIDLNGDNLKLPPNVELRYSGGSITNGTLTLDGGIIDSRLMNKNLTIKGDFMLRDNKFILHPSQWDFVEGRVSQASAKTNKETLQDLIDDAKSYGATRFEIDSFDAYFEIGDPTGRVVPENAAIKLPSNFTLKMTNNTHLRVQPNNYKKHTLLSITGGNDNVVIEGGNLYGDRDEHDYSSGGTHEWGHILQVKGTSNSTIKGVTFRNATGDGLNISGIYHYFDQRHIASQQILVKNNKFYNCRRINMSITSGNHITVENNTFVDGGIDTDKSKGAAPRCNFNIESFRRWENGVVGSTLKEYEKVSHVYVRNNTQKGRGRFLTHHGDGPIIYEGNNMESAISFQYANGVEIKNNTFKGSQASTANGNAITAGVANTTEHPLVFGNKVYGNQISGYMTGINVGGHDVKIYNNVISASNGMVIGDGRGDGLIKAVINNNTINADKYGIRARKLLKDVTIKDNIVNANSLPLYLVDINKNAGQENAKLIVTNNTLRGKLSNTTYPSKKSKIGNSNGIDFKLNKVNGGIEVVGSRNLLINTNTFSSQNMHGVRFLTTTTINSRITDNKFNLSSNFECIKKDVTLNSSVVMSNNSCN